MRSTGVKEEYVSVTLTLLHLPGVNILPFTINFCRGKEKNEKAKTGKGKNWKFTHFWREIAFFHILTIFFTLFLSCFLFYVYFFLSLILFFFFSLFSCCQRDFWHGCRHFVGFLYPIFIFFSSPCLDFFIPYFCAAGGISPLF